MKTQAQALIDFGDSLEQAEGFGMMRVIEAVQHYIDIEGDEVSDGEVIDMIYELINK